MPNVFSPEFWKSQWEAIMVAPWIIIPILLLCVYLGWRWRRSRDEGEVRALQAQLAARNAQLDLARDQEKIVSTKLAETLAEFAALKDQVTRRASYDMVSITIGRTEKLITDTSTANNALGTTLTPTTELSRFPLTRRSD